MSYSLTVNVKDGVAEINGPATTTAPDGTFIINGHTEPAWESIGIARIAPGQRQAISLQGYANKEGEIK